jgi:threonine dehydrogenase-like Zn-dependent dehydrogenase
MRAPKSVAVRAITVLPGVKDSIRLDDVAEPPIGDGTILVRARALGVCGTDHEILEGLYGSAPVGAERLVLGHESLGIVIDAPPGCGISSGDCVVGVVRRPDPVPCPYCAAGEWDMCRNGGFTERGIKERHGFGSERFRIEPEFAIKVDRNLGLAGVLMEPASIVAKGWDHVERVGRRSRVWAPRNLLVTGAGPIGLLAALLGRERNLDIHVVDRNTEGPKPGLIRDLGATHHATPDSLRDLSFDVVMECTAATPLVVEAMARCAPSGIVCLLGVSAPGRAAEFDIGGFNRKLVLGNEVVFGAVNANLSHYRQADLALAHADRTWLDRLITRRVPLSRWREAFTPRSGDIKVVIEFPEPDDIAA